MLPSGLSGCGALRNSLPDCRYIHEAAELDEAYATSRHPDELWVVVQGEDDWLIPAIVRPDLEEGGWADSQGMIRLSPRPDSIRVEFLGYQWERYAVPPSVDSAVVRLAPCVFETAH